ncbi:lipopolysaccharide biosynthesis protein [Rufibacter sp. XAAS-G3-1]|uniref:lipopolysaccharide biosynthesis protein n=1 Tax=Rufibacter sp. XAAS-G3-1 TaxID=2729134 RepID=UPI001C62CF96|nr:polysaccharide biosynthesis protein [Rufibacter sp. XAAS-G3-1]
MTTQNLTYQTKYKRVFEWGKIIAITGSSQILVQAVGFLSGILIIRMLSTTEYALYTIANTMLGTMLVLTNGGIVTGLISEGSKVWQDKDKLGAVMVTGMELRNKFSFFSLIIAIPIMLYLLLHHGSTWLMSCAIVISIIPIYFLTLSGALLEIPAKLTQDIVKLQKIQIGSNLLRLIFVSVLLFISPWAFVVLLAAGIPQLWTNIRIRKAITGYTNLHQRTEPGVRDKIISVVKKILPGSVYYCLSGQITIWLISVFGTTSSVAQIGALGRLAMVLSIFTIVFNTLVTPRFARLPNESNILLTRYTQITAGTIAFFLVIILFTWLFPKEILWILGESYSNLESEIVFYIIGTSISMTAGGIFSLYISKGWIINPIVSIPISLLSVSILIFTIDISTLSGILIFNIIIATSELLMHSIFVILKLKSIIKD